MDRSGDDRDDGGDRLAEPASVMATATATGTDRWADTLDSFGLTVVNWRQRVMIATSMVVLAVLVYLALAGTVLRSDTDPGSPSGNDPVVDTSEATTS